MRGILEERTVKMNWGKRKIGMRLELMRMQLESACEVGEEEAEEVPGAAKEPIDEEDKMWDWLAKC